MSDADPWVMYRVYTAGLLYIYVPDFWKILSLSYVASSLCYILSFMFEFMQGAVVHHLFTYPVAVTVGVFVSRAVAEKPCKHPTFHVLSVLPWMVTGFYGPIGYPTFLFVYMITLLIARMYRWATVSGICMVLNSVVPPMYSPLFSLSIPIVVLFVYSWFEDIYSSTPLELEV